MLFKKYSPFRLKIFNGLSKTLLINCLILLPTVFSYAQSTNQNFPTPLLENQINGQIKARDIGDSRLTTYFYVFNGGRGDVFINVLTTNFNGDLDIFSAEGLEPKTKITLFADDTQTETGRVIYLRKSEKLILRIKGRTPNDDDASFQIKFAGSFLPSGNIAENSVPEEPKVNSATQGKVKVNSVGTIIEEPKTAEKIAESVTAKNSAEISEVSTENGKIDNKSAADSSAKENKTEKQSEEKSIIGKNSVSDKEFRVISPTFDPTKSIEDRIKENKKQENPRVKIPDSTADKNNNTEPNKEITADSVKEVTVDIIEKAKNTSAVVSIEMIEDDDNSTEVKKDSAESKVENNANLLAGIFLNVQLKNGENFKRSMSEVLSMNVIKGILTIVTNDGKIQEYSILDVAKMTIE